MKGNKLIMVLFVALLLQTTYLFFLGSPSKFPTIQKVTIEDKNLPFTKVEKKKPIYFSTPACNIEIKSTFFYEKGNSAVLFFSYLTQPINILIYTTSIRQKENYEASTFRLSK